MMQVCAMACGQTLDTTSGSPLSPSQTTKNTSPIPRFFRSVSTAIQKLRALTTAAGPEPEDVPLTSQRDADRRVERAVGDLTVADLDHDRVDEHRGVDRAVSSDRCESA